MIRLEALTKSFAGTVALDRGEVVGLLGPNGAGKTTCLRVLTCFVPPSSGGARIDGLVQRLEQLVPWNGESYRRSDGWTLHEAEGTAVHGESPGRPAAPPVRLGWTGIGKAAWLLRAASIRRVTPGLAGHFLISSPVAGAGQQR